MITFQFGKFKGQTLEEVAGTEDGVKWLEWLIEQPCEGKYAAANQKRNKEIEDYLGGILPTKINPPGRLPASNEEAQIIIAKLDEIISLISGQK